MRGLRTPVLLTIFNRPIYTSAVFEEIRRARPAALYVSGDGPRPDRPEDKLQCADVRRIVGHVDWDCRVRTQFSDANLGIKVAMSAAINWFFEQEEEGIILEDDCVPSQSFFRFCEELLERYRNDRRIMQISGCNFLMGRRVTEDSYFFAKLNDIWGWATWRRAWELYDPDMKTFPRFKAENQLRNYLDDPAIAGWLMGYFEDAVHATKAEGIWSTAWTYAICAENGLVVVPSMNLVKNVGFAGDGTHGGSSFRLYSGIDREEISLLRHPRFVLPSREADALRFKLIRRTDPRLLKGSMRQRVGRVTSRLKGVFGLGKRRTNSPAKSR